MKHQFFQYCQQSLAALCLMTLSACSAANSNKSETLMAVYPSQILYFHYFQLDVPKDINQDASIVEANFAGNRFHAYPIASQKAFDQLVNERINVFKNHKLSQAALDYEKKKRETIKRVGDAEDFRSYPELNMTTALYKAIKHDDQHYNIIANSLGNMDSTFQSNLLTQWYIYVPEQHKYIMTKQAMNPSRILAAPDIEEKGRTFLRTQIRPLSVQALSNPKVMALGPIAWIDADFHPTIEYRMQSKAAKMDIHLDVDSVSNDKYDGVKYTLKDLIKRIENRSDGKARSLNSGSRTVSAMKGQERCYYVPSTDLATESHYVWCAWGTDGIKENLDNPSMLLEMKYYVGASSSDQKVALQAWEQLIGSLKRRGKS